ncbi:hypothetical protein A9262_05710 [Vibrio splendidus]|nr:hypothetical protein A9262_05710 [Vibrio splendidus]
MREAESSGNFVIELIIGIVLVVSLDSALIAVLNISLARLTGNQLVDVLLMSLFFFGLYMTKVSLWLRVRLVSFIYRFCK